MEIGLQTVNDDNAFQSLLNTGYDDTFKNEMRSALYEINARLQKLQAQFQRVEPVNEPNNQIKDNTMMHFSPKRTITSLNLTEQSFSNLPIELLPGTNNFLKELKVQLGQINELKRRNTIINQIQQSQPQKSTLTKVPAASQHNICRPRFQLPHFSQQSMKYHTEQNQKENKYSFGDEGRQVPKLDIRKLQTQQTNKSQIDKQRSYSLANQKVEGAFISRKQSCSVHSIQPPQKIEAPRQVIYVNPSYPHNNRKVFTLKPQNLMTPVYDMRCIPNRKF